MKLFVALLAFVAITNAASVGDNPGKCGKDGGREDLVEISYYL